ncbi:hypothetical protein CBL_10959 [Carabus blaptoides fortunei]
MAFRLTSTRGPIYTDNNGRASHHLGQPWILATRIAKCGAQIHPASPEWAAVVFTRVRPSDPVTSPVRERQQRHRWPPPFYGHRSSWEPSLRRAHPGFIQPTTYSLLVLITTSDRLKNRHTSTAITRPSSGFVENNPFDTNNLRVDRSYNATMFNSDGQALHISVDIVAAEQVIILASTNMCTSTSPGERDNSQQVQNIRWSTLQTGLKVSLHPLDNSLDIINCFIHILRLTELG